MGVGWGWGQCHYAYYRPIHSTVDAVVVIVAGVVPVAVFLVLIRRAIRLLTVTVLCKYLTYYRIQYHIIS